MTELISEEPIPSVARESLGVKLSRAREAQNMSVADVAHTLRLSVRQIEAIEADDHDRLPGRTFVRGFVRNYARLVNLDPDNMLAEYFPILHQAETQHIQVPSQRISFSEHHRKPWLKWLAIGFVVVALISWGVLVWLGPESAKPVAAAKTAAPAMPAFSGEMPVQSTAATPEIVVPAQSDAQAAAPQQEKVVTPTVSAPLPAVAQAHVLLNFSGPSWVEVRDKSGKKIHSQNNAAGTQQTIEGEPPLSLIIGSAPNVKLTYKGHLVDLNAFTKTDVARLTLE